MNFTIEHIPVKATQGSWKQQIKSITKVQDDSIQKASTQFQLVKFHSLGFSQLDDSVIEDSSHKEKLQRKPNHTTLFCWDQMTKTY